MGIFLGIILTLGIIALIIFLFFVVLYNGLVAFREAVKKALSDIDVQLRQRFDMIPQLIDAVKGAMKFENQTLTDIVNARNEALGALNKINEANQTGGAIDQELFDDLATKAATLKNNLGNFKVVMEQYPDIKSVAAVQDLMENISTIENKINFTRAHYNQTVQDYETKRSSIPSCIVAIILPLKFPTYGYYSDEQKEEIKQAPKISL